MNSYPVFGQAPVEEQGLVAASSPEKVLAKPPPAKHSNGKTAKRSRPPVELRRALYPLGVEPSPVRNFSALYADPGYNAARMADW